MIRFVRTASTSIYLSIWAVLNTVHRSMVTFVYLPFLAVDPVDADPFVTRVPSHKSILPDWVD